MVTSKYNRLYTLVLTVLLFIFSCSSAQQAGSDSQQIYGADDSMATSTDGLTGTVPIGSTLRTTTNVNFRTGPGTSHSVIRVLSTGTSVVTVNYATPTSAFYNVEQQGTIGWVHGAYLKLVSNNVVDGGVPQSAGRDVVINRAKEATGFSYWWGHGRWRPEGATSSTAGSCNGSCPNCSHGGSYGADCSGMVAKAWQVPSSNDDVTVDDHPYSTLNFVSDTSQWSTVSRNSLISADALVYNSGGSGHVVIYESGDGWGSMWVYECKGCSYGCVHDLRTFSSTYHGIRRAGL